MTRGPKAVTTVLCAALLAAAPLAASAEQAARWEFAGWSGGGAYVDVRPDPNVYGRVWLVSDVAGVWRSEDRGDAWSPRTAGLSTVKLVCLTVAKSDSNVLYAAAADGIFRTDDAGGAWRALPGPKDRLTFRRAESHRAIAVDRGEPDKLYAGTADGQVYQSADGGQTFQRVGRPERPFGAPGAITALHLSRDGRFLFAASARGLLRYDFTVGTWQRASPPDPRVLDLVSYLWKETLFVPAGDRVAWSADMGATWASSARVPMPAGAHVERVAVRTDRAGELRLAAAWRKGWRGGLAVSPDGGRTWRDAGASLVHDEVGNPTRAWMRGFSRPLAVAFDPFEPDTLYFSDFWGVWRSDDGGATWAERVRGAPNAVGTDLAFGADGALFAAAMDDGLLRSEDAGVSYRAVAPARPEDEAFKGHVWRVLPIGGRVVATASPWDAGPNQVLLSEDGGRTFRRSVAGLPGAYPSSDTVWDKGYARALAADPGDPDTLYLGIDGEDGGGLYVSRDGGSTWRRAESQPPSLRVYNGLAVDPLEPRRLYWGTAGTSANGGIYRSEDGGLTWQKVFSATGWVFDVLASPDGSVYAATDSGGPAVYVSRDRGTRWELSRRFDGAGACEALALDPSDPRRVAVGTVRWDGADGRVYLSADAGVTWEDITGDLPNGPGPAAMAFSPDGHLYLTRYAGGVYRTKLSTTRKEGA